MRSQNVAIIPARGGSKGIPGKNLVEFCGKPLIQWTLEQALAAPSVAKVYVSTDDPRIGEVSGRAGADVIERPAELATDTSSSEEALLHALERIEEAVCVGAVVFLQATSPLREVEDIEASIQTFSEGAYDSLFSASLLHGFCAWEETEGGLRSVTYDFSRRGRRQDRKPLLLENGSVYVFRPAILRKHRNRLGGKIGYHLMEGWKSFEIDTLEDLELCEFYMRRMLLSGKNVPVALDKIRLVVYDFDGVFTDNKVIVREDGMESVTVNRADGLAIGMIKNKGIKQVIFTTETNRVVEARAKKLNIPVIKGVDDKKKALLSYCADHEIPLESVMYVGNDINDMEAMKRVGYPVCPADATEEVKKISKIIITVPGGAGVIRELLYYFD